MAFLSWLLDELFGDGGNVASEDAPNQRATVDPVG